MMDGGPSTGMLRRRAVILIFLISFVALERSQIVAAHTVVIPSNVYFHLWQQDTYINFASTTNLENIALESNRLCLDPYWFSVENANLTISRFFVSHLLIFIVDTPVQSQSIIQVYVGDKGEPSSVHIVNGTLTWNYDVSTQTLTFTILHVNAAEVTVDWGILGDVDNDGDVDSDDLHLFAGAYGFDSERGNFNPEADTNRDGNIDVGDLYLLARNYGEISSW